MKLIIIQETNQVINLTTWRIGGDMGVSRDALVPVTIGVDEAPKSLNEHELPKVVKDGGTFVFTWYETLVLGNERWEKKKKKKQSWVYEWQWQREPRKHMQKTIKMQF